MYILVAHLCLHFLITVLACCRRFDFSWRAPQGAGPPIHKPVFYETMVSDISCGKNIGFAS